MRIENFEHYVESIFMNDKSHKTLVNSSSLSRSKHREKRAMFSKRKMRNLTSEYDSMKRYHAAEPVVSIFIFMYISSLMTQS
jgi:hypothetical protein